MIETVREIQKIISDLRASLAQIRSERVNRESVKEKVRSVVDGYFRTDRPILLKRYRDESLFRAIDLLCQELLRYTHSRTATSKYKAVVARLQSEWESLEVNTIAMFGDLTGGEVIDPTSREQLIIDTLRQLSPSAAACYEQALRDLEANGRLSWRGTATRSEERRVGKECRL